MSETEKIAKIAELVSDELFNIFGWERHAVRNQNWTCAMPETHNTDAGSHPADVVFTYEDAYQPTRTYVLALK
jgi:hypothetical protein